MFSCLSFYGICDSIKTHNRVSAAKKDVRHTSVLFIATAKSSFSTPHISITTVPISVQIHIFYALHVHNLAYQIWSKSAKYVVLRYAFLKIAQFSSCFSSSSHQSKTITLSQEKQPFSGWISFKFGTLIQHILAHLHIKFGDV